MDQLYFHKHLESIPDQTVTVGENSNIAHLFDAATGKRLN